MTSDQFQKIKAFAQSFYDKADQFHDMRHAELTVTYAMLLAKDFSDANLQILEAACLLHDIGRINMEDGHPHESARLAKPFLEEIGLSSDEKDAILHAVSVHGVHDIHTAHSIEAKLLFDADKLQQLSVYGFLRMCFYMVAISKMDMTEAVENRWKKVQEIWKSHIQTEKAKEILEKEVKKIEVLVHDFQRGLHAKLE